MQEMSPRIRAEVLDGYGILTGCNELSGYLRSLRASPLLGLRALGPRQIALQFRSKVGYFSQDILREKIASAKNLR
jgi:hypothetical protein